MDQHRQGQDEAVTRQTVLALALAHHLVSKYTSLVAVDKELVRPTDKTLLLTQALPTNLLDGQDYQAIFGLPNTATGWRGHVLFGLVLLMVALLAWRHRTHVA